MFQKNGDDARDPKKENPGGNVSLLEDRAIPVESKFKGPPDRSAQLHEVKSRIHRKLVERMDFSHFEKQDAGLVQEEVRRAIEELCETENVLLSYSDRRNLVGEILDEAFGLGPLEMLMKDPTITDILVNGPRKVFVERGGRLEMTDIQFRDDAHLLRIIEKIVSAIGRRCDETTPMVDARLPDGSRVNAIIPPVAIDGPAVSIRRFGVDPVRLSDLLAYKSLAPEMVEFLQAAVQAKLNIAILGGTGSGKTTLLNNLASLIPPVDRIVTLEDAAELNLHQPHVVRLESRPPNVEGKGQIAIRDLLINALRMRPDRIIVGEVRGGEALDMMQAMNTGHEGSMTTVHANSPRDAIARIETMVAMSGLDLPTRAIRQQFVSAVNLMIQVARLTGGPRKVLKISEVIGMEGEVVTMQDLFVYEQEGVGENGKAYGSFKACGNRPMFLERLSAFGVKLAPELFEARVLMKDYE
jgi:pilus assembly protein CpaF